MGIDNNDDIAKMFGMGADKKSNRYTPQMINVTGTANKYMPTKTEKEKDITMDEIKINPSDLDGIGKKLENIPPLLLLGIVSIIIANFTPYKFLFTLGFLLIIVGVFDKALSKEKKEEIWLKIKGLFKRK